MFFKNKPAALILIFFLCVMLSSCGNPAATTANAPLERGKFEVSVLSIGKADAIILRTENKTAVIDCGGKDDGKAVLDFLSSVGTNRIDYLFITHFDHDHVGGAGEVIEGIQIGEVITPKYESDGEEYKNYKNALDEKGITPTRITKERAVMLDSVTLSIYPPQKTEYKEEDNDFSLVISASHGENTFLFAGDSETERIKELKNQLDLEHTFLKVPHHGRYCEGIEKFLIKVRPKYAVITCGKNTRIAKKVINALDSVNAKVYLTSDGDVHVTSDGESITVVSGK